MEGLPSDEMKAVGILEVSDVVDEEDLLLKVWRHPADNSVIAATLHAENANFQLVRRLVFHSSMMHEWRCIDQASACPRSHAYAGPATSPSTSGCTVGRMPFAV